MGALTRAAEFVFGPSLNRTPAEADVSALMTYEVPRWYQDALYGVSADRLSERVWVANRCQQMNSQQIATMPLEFHGGSDATPEPLWVSQPDPNLYPNGIADALYAIVDNIYGHGYALLYMTDWYYTGYPRTWTVLDSGCTDVKIENGARAYYAGQQKLDASRILQIDRNPGMRAHGTPALKAYAQVALGLIAAGEQSAAVNAGLYPSVYLQPKRAIDEEQAEKLQAQWVAKTSQRRGAPPVVPPDIDVHDVGINLESLQLLSAQDYGVRAVCSAYGVPSMLLNFALTGGLTYQNPALLGEAWWRFELRPVSARIGDALSTMLPRGQYVSFKAEDTFAPLTTSSPDDDEQAAVDDPSLDTGTAPTPPAVTP